MARFNREDARTVLPQLEKQITTLSGQMSEQLSSALKPKEIELIFVGCTSGLYSCCYKIGAMVFLSFNINIQIVSSGIPLIAGLPAPLHKAACCAVSDSKTCRFYVDTNGTLKVDGNMQTGWLNGSIAYACDPNDFGQEYIE